MGRSIRGVQKAGSADVGVDWKQGVGVHAQDRVAIRRGIVEYNRDPTRRGRVKVRIAEDGPEISEQNKGKVRKATLHLAWYLPLFGLGAGTGFGAFTVPPVGARVYVMYERAHPDMGVYFGGWYANPYRQRRYGVTESTLTPPLKQFENQEGYNEEGDAGGQFALPPKETVYQGHWTEEQGPELPLELREMVDHTPDSQMIFKTLKGASMMIKERDEAEELIITDRLGAEIRFQANTELIEDGVLRRGRSSATMHEPMGLDKLVTGSHLTTFLNPAGVGMTMESHVFEDDSLRIQVHPEQEEIRNPELMSTRLAVELDHGEKRVRILQLTNDIVTGEITFDVAAQKLDIRGIKRTQITAEEEVTIEAAKIRVLGDLDVEGEIRHLGGKKLTFLENDNEPYGSQTRNFWTHKSVSPPPYDDKKAAEQLNERRWW